ncbi:hypothetical protein MA16_Dca017036 [Dendrobium catenatum]|uniref:Uncharacterized protein n=1 Tax=Dendrobium catenatum TaxID=906689 RepID=A0A2I0V9H8_9ASPA|nr:hypothetical protein MA16_Dca017036 [Dendrobium catenatum]
MDGDLSNIPFKISIKAFLLYPRRSGKSKEEVAFTHFAKKPQCLGPITDHPRNHKKEGDGVESS